MNRLRIFKEAGLFQYFNDRYDEVKLEPWLSEIKQRPDLMVRKGTTWTVIEFQCAPITIERIRGANGWLSAVTAASYLDFGRTLSEKRICHQQWRNLPLYIVKN